MQNSKKIYIIFISVDDYIIMELLWDWSVQILHINRIIFLESEFRQLLLNVYTEIWNKLHSNASSNNKYNCMHHISARTDFFYKFMYNECNCHFLAFDAVLYLEALDFVDLFVLLAALEDSSCPPYFAARPSRNAFVCNSRDCWSRSISADKHELLFLDFFSCSASLLSASAWKQSTVLL